MNSLPRWMNVVLFLGLFVFGCDDGRPKTYPVRGAVRFPDGKLLRNGWVEFEIQGVAKAATARGEIGPDGSFTLGTYALTDGAVAGRHRVLIASDEHIGNGVERPSLLSASELHPRYQLFRTSKIEVEVKPEPNEFVFDVEYAPSVSDDEDEQPEDDQAK